MNTSTVALKKKKTNKGNNNTHKLQDCPSTLYVFFSLVHDFFQWIAKIPSLTFQNSRISSLLAAGDVSPAQIPLLAKRPFRRNVSPAQIPLLAKGPFRRNVSPAQILPLAKGSVRRNVSPAQIPLLAKGPFRRNFSPAQIPLLAKRPFRRNVTPVLQAS